MQDIFAKMDVEIKSNTLTHRTSFDSSVQQDDEVRKMNLFIIMIF